YEIGNSGGTTNAAQRRGLVDVLTDHLYANFFSRGQPQRSREVPLTAWSRLSPFVADLSAANAGTGSWQPGWQIGRLDGTSLVVERNGLRLWADPEEVAGPLHPGSPVAVKLPNEMLAMSPGFYVALGDRGPTPGEAMIRLYWNLSRDSAAAFVAAAT